MTVIAHPANNNLDGFIPKEIGLLTELRQLNLRSNSLKGPIPGEMAHLRTLSKLDGVCYPDSNRLGSH